VKTGAAIGVAGGLFAAVFGTVFLAHAINSPSPLCPDMVTFAPQPDITAPQLAYILAHLRTVNGPICLNGRKLPWEILRNFRGDPATAMRSNTSGTLDP
jgi:hypothetical protein